MEDEILGEGELEHEPAPLAILRDVPQARFEMVVSVRVREIVTFDHDTPRARAAQPRQGIDQLRLAVAVHAGDADDLPGPDME